MWGKHAKLRGCSKIHVSIIGILKFVYRGFCFTFNFSEDESAKEDKDDVDNEETDDSARASAHAHAAHRRHARRQRCHFRSQHDDGAGVRASLPGLWSSLQQLCFLRRRFRRRRRRCRRLLRRNGSISARLHLARDKSYGWRKIKIPSLRSSSLFGFPLGRCDPVWQPFR